MSDTIAHNTPFVHIERLTHTYTPEHAAPVTALRGIDLDIAAGEYVALIGANGSGKSTLARHLNALLLPTSGEVCIAGLDTRNPAARRDIRALVGMVFQIPVDQIVGTVVQEDVAFGPENLGVPRPLLLERVEAALERVGMWAWRERPPHMLSPGQQQRVAIAGALAMEPRCLVLDEASSMLDPIGRRDLLDLVERLHGDGLTIITITHDMDEAARARRVVVVQRGQLLLDGSTAEVFSQPEQLEAAGLALPSVAELARRLHRRDPGFPARLLTVEALAAALAGGRR